MSGKVIKYLFGGISCGVRSVDVKGSEVMCEKGLK